MIGLLCIKYIHDVFYIKSGDKYGIATSYNNIGVVYEKQENYPEALKNYFTSLKLMEEIKNKQDVARSYMNIGNIYIYQGNYPVISSEEKRNNK